MAITGEQARDAVERIAATARAAGIPCAIAIVDPIGDLVAVYRMDGAARRFIVPAMNKAYTAALREMTTEAFHAELVARKLEISYFGDPRFTALPGGFPVYDADGSLIAAIGVTGRTKGRDTEFGLAGVAAFGAGATSPE